MLILCDVDGQGWQPQLTLAGATPSDPEQTLREFRKKEETEESEENVETRRKNCGEVVVKYLIDLLQRLSSSACPRYSSHGDMGGNRVRSNGRGLPSRYLDQ